MPSSVLYTVNRMLERIIDSDGREVILSEKTWLHIVEAHPELERHLPDVMRAVNAPTRRLPGRLADEEWFYLAEAGPSRWLKVVVHYERGRGRVITAFARRSLP
jgi:hypothetical protein